MQAGTRSDASRTGPKMLPDKRKTPPRDAVLCIGDGLREIVSALRTETERAKEEHNAPGAVGVSEGNTIKTA
jgi:hypothetical protein